MLRNLCVAVALALLAACGQKNEVAADRSVASVVQPERTMDDLVDKDANGWRLKYEVLDLLKSGEFFLLDNGEVEVLGYGENVHEKSFLPHLAILRIVGMDGIYATVLARVPEGYQADNSIYVDDAFVYRYRAPAYVPVPVGMEPMRVVLLTAQALGAKNKWEKEAKKMAADRAVYLKQQAAARWRQKKVSSLLKQR